MRIALTADPELPVPPRLYGGIERIVDMLARGLTARGHDVTLFAHPDSATAGRLVAWPGGESRSLIDTLRNAAMLATRVAAERFDVLHSFSRLAYLMPTLPSRLPKIMSYQREISPRTTRLAHALSRGTLEFTAISRWMMAGVSDIGRWHLVPNGVELSTYTFAPTVAPDAPLVFLGRIEEIKGPHLAIEIARRVGRRLVIAGNIPTDKRAWVEANVLAHVDGTNVTYAGPVDDTAKNALLGSAFAFLMPILWEEPFGIVMAEALACGTPVIGLRRGAVPEVVVDGVTGFVRDDIAGLVAALSKVRSLSRAACRADAEARFSADPIVDAYETIYHATTARVATRKAS
ncbi:MAG: glycosyltransferase family 4 protein [Hyphomonadaceae bacterium]|nr:glycosyltransferase family 4 protein [Hyphomonadaceae bacterium]MBY0565130.1 glycosyltransferase family 4 protein [Hyphomonadaceae bacterium]